MPHLAMTPPTGPIPPELEEFLGHLARGESAETAYFSLFGLGAGRPLAALGAVRQGLPFQALERFARSLELSYEELTGLLAIALRTLHRRKARGRLSADEADRLLRIGRIFARSIELFEGDLAAARHWLRTPQPVLGSEAPLQLAATELGAREVDALIGRLEHGIPS